MISAVLFDAGGVILDESEHERVRAEIIVENLRSAVPDYSHANYRLDIAEAINCYCPNVYDYVFWKRLQLDRPLHDEVHRRYMHQWRENVPPLKLMHGFDSLARELAENFALGIAGQYGGEIIDVVEEHSILDSFKWKFTQDDFEITKPDPRFYEQIAKACGVDPRECIVVGDRIDKDIVPARLLRMKTVLIRGGLHKDQQPRMPYEIPAIELDGISALASAIMELAGRE